MRKTLLIVLLVILGGSAGLGLAFLVSRNANNSLLQTPGVSGSVLPNGLPRPSDRGGFTGRGMGGGMMQPYNYQSPNLSAARISMDQALEKINTAVNSIGSDFVVAEVMEFDQNFYAAVLEKSTGRGAFELLVDPYAGSVSYEMGPNMMWNLKYGQMVGGLTITQDNSVTLAEAKDLAQKALDTEGKAATVAGDGVNFYGYYTFDYQIDGKIAGMLSVNGLNGQVWFHTWHGTFISEKELSQ